MLLTLIFSIIFFSYTQRPKTASIKYLKKKIKKGVKKSRGRYQVLSEEEKNKMWQYECKRYKNLSEDEKQKLLEYIKYYKISYKIL